MSELYWSQVIKTSRIIQTEDLYYSPVEQEFVIEPDNNTQPNFLQLIQKNKRIKDQLTSFSVLSEDWSLFPSNQNFFYTLDCPNIEKLNLVFTFHTQTDFTKIAKLKYLSLKYFKKGSFYDSFSNYQFHESTKLEEFIIDLQVINTEFKVIDLLKQINKFNKRFKKLKITCKRIQIPLNPSVMQVKE